MFSSNAGILYKELMNAVDLFSNDQQKHMKTVCAIIAANSNNEELVKLFNATNGTTDYNPLQLAVFRATNRELVIKELLKLKGLDLNIIHKSLGTLLHIAVGENSKSAILMLIQKGADPKIRCHLDIDSAKGDLTAAELAEVYANKATQSNMLNLWLSLWEILHMAEKSDSKESKPQF